MSNSPPLNGKTLSLVAS